MPTLSSIVCSLVCAVGLAGGRVEEAAGRWSGRMETPEISARIELTLEPTGATWEGALTAFVPRELRSEAVDLAVDGDRLSFHAAVAEADVAFDGRVADGLVTGEIVVSQDGRFYARGLFGLARPDAGPAGAARIDAFLASESEPLDEGERAEALLSLDRLLRTKYVFPDVGARVAAEIGPLDLGRGQSASGFASMLSDELFARSTDAHLKVKRAGEPVEDPDRLEAGSETPAERAALRDAERADNFGFRSVSILPGNIGYLDLRRLVRADLAGDTLAATMAFVANTDALIIDLRECGGGHPSLPLVLISYLVDGLPQHVGDLHRRPENEIAQMWTLPWVAGARYLDRDVFVLTARRTFSAAEGLAFDLSALGRATLVGERTGGGAHAGRWYPLSEHFAAFIPTTRATSVFVEGDWEGDGVAPDVEVPAEAALTRACELALERRAAPRLESGEPRR